MSKVKSLSRVQLFATPRTVVYQVPPSVGFSIKKKYSDRSLIPAGLLPNSSGLQRFHYIPNQETSGGNQDLKSPWPWGEIQK